MKAAHIVAKVQNPALAVEIVIDIFKKLYQNLSWMSS